VTITISFMSANDVARETGFAMKGWGHGDRATNDAFRPAATYRARLDALLARVAALGFSAIDLWGAHLNPEWATDEHVSAARESLAVHGLAVAAYQVYVEQSYLETACAIAERLGTTLLSGFAPVEDEHLPHLLARHGLRLAYENHPEPTPTALLDRIGSGSRPGVGVCVDTGWFATQGYDPVRALEELEGTVLHVHLKDVLHAGEPHETCRWGDGVVDVEGCVRVLRRSGYGGAISIEHEPAHEDPTEDLREMRARLEEWLA
jgi:L-ribulose-5-phosphate 3-epimerase